MWRILKLTGWLMAGAIIVVCSLLMATRRPSTIKYWEIDLTGGSGSTFEGMASATIGRLSVGTSDLCQYDIQPESEWVIINRLNCSNLDLDYETELIAINALSGKQKLVTTMAGSEWFLGFSPDGEWLYFSHDGINNQYSGDLYRYHLQSERIEQLTSRPNYHEYILGWSPDGEWLYFASGLDGTFSQIGIGRMRPDGSDFQLLISDAMPVTFADMSPQGQWIIYSRWNHWAADRFFRDPRLYRMRPDGSDVRAIFPIALSDRGGVYTWSPDGEWLVFQQKFEGHNHDIIKLRVADGYAERLVGTPHDEQLPYLPIGYYPRQVAAVSPDGAWVYYTGAATSPDEGAVNCGDWVNDLYRVRFDGAIVQQITAGGGQEDILGWTPDGEWIIREGVYLECRSFTTYIMRPDGTDLQTLSHGYSGWIKANYQQWSLLVLLISAGLAAMTVPFLAWLRRRFRLNIS